MNWNGAGTTNCGCSDKDQTPESPLNALDPRLLQPSSNSCRCSPLWVSLMGIALVCEASSCRTQHSEPLCVPQLWHLRCRSTAAGPVPPKCHQCSTNVPWLRGLFHPCSITSPPLFHCSSTASLLLYSCCSCCQTSPGAALTPMLLVCDTAAETLETVGLLWHCRDTCNQRNLVMLWSLVQSRGPFGTTGPHQTKGTTVILWGLMEPRIQCDPSGPHGYQGSL